MNALLWPLLLRVALPFTVLTLGIGALLLNGLVTLLAAAVAPGVELDGLGSAVVLGVALAAVVTGWSALLALDDDVRVLRPALRHARDAGPRDPAAAPGVLFLEIEGLAVDVLRRAVRDVNAPAIASRLHDGTHRLHGWETDWSSQTARARPGSATGTTTTCPRSAGGKRSAARRS